MLYMTSILKFISNNIGFACPFVIEHKNYSVNITAYIVEYVTN